MEPARPSATPLKNSTGKDLGGGGEPPYDGGMEHRMTALETRLDTILPTLATKADLESVRLATKADMDGLRLATKADMESLRVATKADIESLRLATKADLESLRLATKSEIDFLRGEMEKASLRTDAKLAELRSDMHKLNADIKTWTLATMITIVSTMLVALFGISQIQKGTIAALTPHQAPVVAPSSAR